MANRAGFQRMNFLVDIGNVLLTLDFESSLKRLVPSEKGDASEIIEVLLERKHDFEAGRISTDDYVDWASKLLGFGGPKTEFVEVWCDIFKKNEPMWSLMRTLKGAGHKLILFSNINPMHAAHIYEAYPEFSIFDASVFSYKVGAAKPEEEIYQHAIDTYSLTPEKTVYIDDLQANIAEGRRHGFNCWQYDHLEHSELLDWLDSQLNPVLSASRDTK